MSLINVARFSADELYEIVATYAGFGNHHTGTPVDAQTTAWLKDVLLSLGASVHEDWFEFDRFVCTAELRVGDQVVPALPVFYSAHGDWRTKDLSVVEANVAGGELAPARDEPVARRRRHLVRSRRFGTVLSGRVIAVPHHCRRDDAAGHGLGRRRRDRCGQALPRQSPMSGAGNPLPR